MDQPTDPMMDPPAQSTAPVNDGIAQAPQPVAPAPAAMEPQAVAHPVQTPAGPGEQLPAVEPANGVPVSISQQLAQLGGEATSFNAMRAPAPGIPVETPVASVQPQPAQPPMPVAAQPIQPMSEYPAPPVGQPPAAMPAPSILPPTGTPPPATPPIVPEEKPAEKAASSHTSVMQLVLLVVVFLVVFLAIGAAGYYFWSRSSSPNATADTTTPPHGVNIANLPTPVPSGGSATDLLAVDNQTKMAVSQVGAALESCGTKSGGMYMNGTCDSVAALRQGGFLARSVSADNVSVAVSSDQQKAVAYASLVSPGVSCDTGNGTEVYWAYRTELKKAETECLTSTPVAS